MADTKEECPICYEPLHDKGVSKTACGHVFCLTCLAKHLAKSSGCPLCRTRIMDPAGSSSAPLSQLVEGDAHPLVVAVAQAIRFPSFAANLDPLLERISEALDDGLEDDIVHDRVDNARHMQWYALQRAVSRYRDHVTATRQPAGLFNMIMRSGDVERFADRVSQRITDDIASAERQREEQAADQQRYTNYRAALERREQRRAADQEAGRVVGATVVFDLGQGRVAVGGSAEEQDRRNRMGRRDLNINLDGSDDGKTAIIRKVLSVNMDVEIQDDTHRIVRIFKKSAYFAVLQRS